MKRKKANGLKKHIGYWMRFVSNSVSYSFARKLEACGVTVAEWVILREMYCMDEVVSSSSIAELTGLTRGAVSKLVERLHQKNLLTRTEASADRRYQDIKMTNAARSLVPELALIADANDEEFFSVLSNAERKQLVEMLKKIVDLKNLKKIPTE